MNSRLDCQRGSADTGTVAAIVIVIGAVAFFRYNAGMWTNLPIWAKVAAILIAVGAFALARRHDANNAWPKYPATDQTGHDPPEPPPQG